MIDEKDYRNAPAALGQIAVGQQFRNVITPGASGE
jgi:hypothetical protein